MTTPEVGKQYRKCGTKQPFNCVYVGDDYAVMYSTALNNNIASSFMLPFHNFGRSDEGGWEEVPKKQTVYVWLMEDTVGTRFTVSGHNCDKWSTTSKVLACHKLELEEGVFCDEWKQAIAERDTKVADATQRIMDKYPVTMKALHDAEIAEKDRSDAGDEISTHKFADNYDDYGY